MRKLFTKLYVTARKNAEARSISFQLSVDDFEDLIFKSNGICAVTGIPFSDERIPSCVRRPWMPSLDRIDNAIGYYPENCRLVCSSVNMAMNEWGEAILVRIATAISRNAYAPIIESVISSCMDAVRVEFAKVAADTAKQPTSYDPPSKKIIPANDSIVRPKNIKDAVGISYTTVWRMEKTGQFPKRRKLTGGAVGWLQSELNAWLESRATL